jgi:pyruvate,orthophosphate dikinase
VGKRTGEAMVRIAIDMWKEGIITDKEALMRVEAEKLQELLLPVFQPKNVMKAEKITQGLPASPGAASGQVVFFANDAAEWLEKGKDVILVRIETSPEDIKGMDSSTGILTSRGGMTSHAAVVARGMGKPCVSGAGNIKIDYVKRTLTASGKKFKEGDWISLDGTTGNVYEGKIATKEAKIGSYFNQLMELVDKHAKLYVMANADTPRDAKTAIDFGAKGIGLCRTEHMFFNKDRIKLIREMILAQDEDGRKTALDRLLPIQRKDFEEIFAIMHNKSVTVRLLDPPLHEFLPEDEKGMRTMAEDMDYTYEEVKEKVRILHEVNPMLGHRGCRLANTYPELSEMQTRAILDAALILQEKGIKVYPEIMVPLTSVGNELRLQVNIIRKTAELLFVERGESIDYKVGTMIEIPRACLIAERISPDVDFFSFGTNDLTQMTFGYSRDDISKFLPIYLRKGILKDDPFQTIDQKGVGELVKVGTAKGRRGNPKLKVGICGEHGGDPESIRFFHKARLDYVSCSPFRIPIARLVTAQANIAEQEVNQLEATKNHKLAEI